ncbi:glycosyl-4,4'-diaponeurosporenoate acyltransferase CrtO family protein [Nocardiopsis oceani]
MTRRGSGGHNERDEGTGHEAVAPPPRARAAMVSVAAAGSTAAAVAAAWIMIGPTGFVFAWIAHFVLMAGVSVALDARSRPLEHPWFRVRRWEVPLYGRLGARLYGRALDAVGWNRVVERGRGFDGTRAGLTGLDQHTRSSEAGHLLCLVVASVLAAAAVSMGSWAGALWLVGLGVLLHVYPVMLQRLLRVRIQVLAGRTQSTS